MMQVVIIYNATLSYKLCNGGPWPISCPPRGLWPENSNALMFTKQLMHRKRL